MDYDNTFNEDVNRKFFYSDYPGNKLVVGKISLQNAVARMAMDEYYVLVTYKEGEQLPKQYVPYEGLSSEDGTLFATVNPEVRVSNICQNGGIQMISRLPDTGLGSPRYLLGPGPEEAVLYDLIQEQYDELYSRKMSM